MCAEQYRVWDGQVCMVRKGEDSQNDNFPAFHMNTCKIRTLFCSFLLFQRIFQLPTSHIASMLSDLYFSLSLSLNPYLKLSL